MGIFSNPKLKKFATNLFVVGLVLVSGIVPATVSAQEGSGTPPTTPPVTTPSTTSFDPAVNPLLKGYQYAQGDTGPSQDPESGKSCRYYVREGSTSQTFSNKGCIEEDGRFSMCEKDTTIEGSVIRGACVYSGGGTSGGEVDTDVEQLGSAVAQVGDDALASAMKGVALFILMLAGTLLAWIGMAFNWVVINTIFDFGAIFGASESMITAWGVMRDVGNIILLFGFILMGVLTILNLHDYPVKKTIPGLIIFAVLLNFSLFASQTVIDVANAFSAVFYEQASSKCEAGVDLKDCIKSDNGGISAIIAQQAGVTSALSISKENHLNQTPMGEGIIMLGLALFVTIAAIVLLAATIMLVIRAVVLCFLMVVSPIGFAGMAIPPLKGLAKSWWNQLLKQAFFAPVFLLLIFVSLKLTEGISKGVLDSGKGLANALAGGTFGGMGIIVTFMVVIGFMIASIVAASKVGAMGAGFATNAAGSLVLGGMARATNFTVGGAAWAAQYGLQRTPKVRDWGVTQVAVNRGLRPLQKANMDLRAAPGMSALLGTMGVKAGAKPGDHIAFADMQHQMHDIAGGKKSAELGETYAGEVKSNKLESEAHHGKLSNEMVAYLGTLSTKELEGLHGIKEGLDSLAKNLSPEQFENLMKSDKLTDIEKGKLKGGRYKEIMGAKTETEARDALKKMSKEDLENLPNGAFSDGSVILAALNDSQREDLAKSKKRTSLERDLIKAGYEHNLIKTKYDAAVANKDTAAMQTALEGISKLNASQAAKLDKSILTNSEAAYYLSPAVLERLASENKLNAVEMQTVGKNIRNLMEVGENENMRKYLESPAGLLW